MRTTRDTHLPGILQAATIYESLKLHRRHNLANQSASIQEDLFLTIQNSSKRKTIQGKQEAFFLCKITIENLMALGSANAHVMPWAHICPGSLKKQRRVPYLKLRKPTVL